MYSTTHTSLSPPSQFADDKPIRLGYQRCDEVGVEQFVIHVAPVFLVPMESWSDGGVTVAQFFVAVGQQFAGEARRAATHVALAVAEPKTQEYLALNTEGYVVVAERLVFCDAMQRQRKVSHLLNVHTNRLLSIFLLLTVEALHLHAELIGKDSVEEDADDSGKSQA